MPKVKGLLLINVGTPRSPETADVRDYLEEFLMDPYVVDIPPLLRWLLVYGLILPFRPAKSAFAYQKIWTQRGSPLLTHLEDLVSAVRGLLGSEWVVEGSMRYGAPSLSQAVRQLKAAGVNECVVLPLYPQYSLAATESSVQKLRPLFEQELPGIPVRFVDPFYDHPNFIQSFVHTAQKVFKNYDWDHVLMSFHGLPERQIRKLDPTSQHCLERADCCDRMQSENQNCYRAQCYQTARLIAAQMGLKQSQYTVCFQSRLGRTRWIQPFTDIIYQELAVRGVKKLVVLCPAFVADCLETLEEVQIRGREDFIRQGGEDLLLVPSLNSSENWAQTVVKIAGLDPTTQCS